jgi:transcriptional regulator with XRE-family HTH domain
MESSSVDYLTTVKFVQASQAPYSLIVALSAALLMGTGAGLTLTNISSSNFVDCAPVITFLQSERGTKEAAVAHYELLRYIRDAFKMSMTELAGVLNVSRAALYLWFQGSTPRPDLRDRLWRLKEHADEVSALNIDHIDLLIKVPLSNGKTILQVLSLDEDVSNAISELSELSESRAASIRRIRNSPSRPNVHRIEEITAAFSDFA